MNYLTWSVFVCTIWMSFFLQANAIRKIDKDSALNKILSYLKINLRGEATYADGRNHVFQYEDKEWKNFDKKPEYKKALKDYLDRVLSPRGMDAKAIHFNGVNILALTPHKENSDENGNNVNIDIPSNEQFDENANNVNFKAPHSQSGEIDIKSNFQSLLDANSNENINHLKAVQSDNSNENIPIVQLQNVGGRKQDDQLVILSPRLRKQSKDSLRRAVFSGPGEVILGAPTRPEHLPEALPILPGHTLLRPARGMLKSAVKYPLRDVGGSEVYGNLNNLGITLGKTMTRYQYSDFRRSNDFLQKLQNSIQHSRGSGKSRPLILIELDPTEILKIKQELQNIPIKKQIAEEENSASHILDDLDSLYNRDNDPSDFRRKKTQKTNSKYRDRDKDYVRTNVSESSSETESEESSEEKNPGNPYTIHKNRYKQNWMWNHKMDGTHMNVNPYAPSMNLAGPSGAELFFARKWWYFNQDDYKPLGRRR